MHFGWRRAAAKANSCKQMPASAKAPERHQAKHAHAEINAYIAIRDSLLAEAEEIPSSSTLHRACIANDVVEIFLKPAKPPYEAQYLSDRRSGP